MKLTLTLPTDSKTRKDYPMATGCDEYFPAALAGVARHSFLAGAKHNLGEPMHHARGKSMDHRDCIRRHMTDLADMVAFCERTHAAAAKMPAAEFVNVGGPEALSEAAGMILTEANALAWRALAYAQELHERFAGAPLAPAARAAEPVSECHCGNTDRKYCPNPDGAPCHAPWLVNSLPGEHRAKEVVQLIAPDEASRCGASGRCVLVKGHFGLHVDEMVAQGSRETFAEQARGAGGIKPAAADKPMGGALAIDSPTCDVCERYDGSHALLCPARPAEHDTEVPAPPPLKLCEARDGYGGGVQCQLVDGHAGNHDADPHDAEPCPPPAMRRLRKRDRVDQFDPAD